MDLVDEPLDLANLNEVVDFFRDANPFAQMTWGWDTGRFVDWHWGALSTAEMSDHGWQSEHCNVYREDSVIRAVHVAEYKGRDVALITRDEDPEAVAYCLDRLLNDRSDSIPDVRLEFSTTSEWLRGVCATAGLVEKPNTGCEWEFDLACQTDIPTVPDGFTIEYPVDDRDLEGIAECIRQAFGSERDIIGSLRRLEANPMFEPELQVFARAPSGQIAAYCRGTVDPVNGVCGIDPVCTHPEFQSMGLGKAVVRKCFANQRELGGRSCYIGSAPEPAPGTFLYRSLGPVGIAVSSMWTSMST
jgi:GNAT superfamily N-acetyltransferase